MSLGTVTIACVVEGHGERSAVPGLLYRIAHELSVWDLRVPEPFRMPRGKLVAASGIEHAVDAQARRVTGAGGVLVLLDADDDCPADRGPLLLARARASRPDMPVSVVLPNREFEAWFIAAAPSLAGQHGFPQDFTSPADPEGIRDAKGWLTRHREGRHPYKETVDQAALASAFDMKLARAALPRLTSSGVMWRLCSQLA